MRARHLGWAGVELAVDGSSIVLDPLGDPAALWQRMGAKAAGVRLPDLAAATTGAALGLITHEHRDHADAGALRAALAPGAPLFGPAPTPGGRLSDAGLAQARAELADAGIDVIGLAPWARDRVDGWTVTALPAVDGLGDPQVSWLVEREGISVVHAGDTMHHGWWWRIRDVAAGGVDLAFLPVNGARIAFPHRRPASPRPAAMGGAEAVSAALELGAGRVVPIHYGAFALPGVYEPDADALATVRAAAEESGVALDVPPVGAWFTVPVATPA